MIVSIYCVLYCFCLFFVFFSSRRRHTRCALVTGVQTCALPILEIGSPSQSSTFDRAVEFITRSNASQADIRELLLALLLVALEESPMRANDEDLAKLSNAVSCAGSHFDIEHDRTRNLCLAIAAISKNVALQIFVQLLLTSVTPKKTTEAAAT